MKKWIIFLILLSLAFVIPLGCRSANEQGGAVIKLMPPETDKGKPLMQVLKERKSGREFLDKKLPQQQLSNLLWAANGINRSDGKRTAPSAKNAQDIDIYVVLEEGIYLYEPKQHELIPIATGDYRKIDGAQGFVASAPVSLIYVSDQAKISWGDSENDKMTVSNLDAGFVAQNAALYCASEGLQSVPRLTVGDKEALAKLLKLRNEQKIILGQTIGYPKL